MPVTRTDTDEVFIDGRLVESRPRVVDVTADVVKLDTHTKLRQWRQENRDYLNLPAAPTAAEQRQQVARLTRQMNALIRLALPDLLTDETLD